MGVKARIPYMIFINHSPCAKRTSASIKTLNYKDVSNDFMLDFKSSFLSFLLLGGGSRGLHLHKKSSILLFFFLFSFFNFMTHQSYVVHL